MDFEESLSRWSWRPHFPIAALGCPGTSTFCRSEPSSLPLLPPQSMMTPKFFRSSNPDKKKKNPSILVQDVDPDDFDLDDCWSGRCSNSASRCRASYPPIGFSRLTTLSSNVLSAGVAITTRAKQLQIRDPTRRAINRLRP